MIVLGGTEVKPGFLIDPFLGLSPRQASREVTLDSCRGWLSLWGWRGLGPLERGGHSRPTWASGEDQAGRRWSGCPGPSPHKEPAPRLRQDMRPLRQPPPPVVCWGRGQAEDDLVAGGTAPSPCLLPPPHAPLPH